MIMFWLGFGSASVLFAVLFVIALCKSARRGDEAMNAGLLTFEDLARKRPVILPPPQKFPALKTEVQNHMTLLRFLEQREKL